MFGDLKRGNLLKFVESLLSFGDTQTTRAKWEEEEEEEEEKR